METDIRLFEQIFKELMCPKLYIYDEIDSTNDRLKEYADQGAADGTVVVALSQTNGHGRSGRTFYSPKGGNLYMSILIRPGKATLSPLITPAGAVATAKAIEKVCGKKVDIKWVNDLYLCGRKICGILAQGYNIGQDSQYIIIGIGINVRNPGGDVPEELRNIYGSVYGNEITDADAAMILPRLSAELYGNYMEMYKNGFQSGLMDEYRSRSNVIGKRVRYISGNDESYIDVIGIDDNGGLVTKDTNGDIVTYMDGEIRIKL